MILVGTNRGLHDLGDGSVAHADRRIVAIAPGRSAPWVLTDDRMVIRGEDRWKIPGQERLHWLEPSGTEILIGAARATLLRLDTVSGAVVRDAGFDSAPGRDDWYTPWGGPPDVRSISKGANGDVYVNVHVGGVVRLRGGKWTDTMDIDADVHQVLAHPKKPGLVAAATARGLAISEDGADTWTFHREGLHAGYCRAVAWAGDRVFLSASRSERGREAAVYRSDDMGASFTRIETGLPERFSTNVNTGCLAASGDTVVIGDEAGTVYRSDDHGESFEVAADDLPEVVCLTLA